MTKNRKMLLGAGGGLAVLCALCVCVAGIAGYIYQDDLMAMLGLAPAQSVAKMLPAETQFYVATNPNVQNLPGYQNLKELYLDNPEIKKILDELEADAAGETDISYETDIKPWLGAEIVVAAPDFAAAIESNDEPPVVIAAKTTNKEASDQFISKFLALVAENDEPFTTESYQEIPLHLQADNFSDQVFTLTTFDDFVIFGNSDTLVKEMIDRSQGVIESPALVDSARYNKVVAELPSEAALTMYMDISGLFGTLMADSPFELPTQQAQDLEAFEAAGIAGTLQPDGIQFDVVVTYDQAKMSEQFKTSLQQAQSPNAVLQDIPAGAIAFYNMSSLQNVWTQAKQSLASTPDFNEGLQDFEQELGISLDDDIFGWMTGEFAMVLLEVTPVDEFIPPFGGYLLIGTDDVADARSRVDKVIGVMEQEGFLPFTPETQTMGGIEMNAIVDPFSGEPQGGYGFYNSYFLMGYLEESIAAAASASQEPITTDAHFKAVQSWLPGTNGGYLYVDIDRGRRLVEDQLSDFEREEYNETARPFVEPIRAVGMSSSTEGVDRGVTKATLFMLLTK